MNYEIILFDIDGTLFDFGKSEENAFQKAFLEFGFPAATEDYRPRYKEISKVLSGELEQGQWE
ncbi:hypothetical protein [Neobacillus niacini]|uniref:hypothetical protein n=1 Tax=Neobacillus niacini TaxID=86668 RepID=UPI0021CAF21E|nr:hypothetical protein [Neobacillus niacini]MCM3765188.1 hypothetical protein [Neobacillus niacini]